MALIECPECKRSVSDQAASCPGCGHPLQPAEPPSSSAAPTPLPPLSTGANVTFLQGIGALLFLGGIAFAIYYYAYFDASVAVPTTEILGHTIGGGRVNNLGLMQEKQNGLMLSIVAALIGFVLAAFGNRIHGSQGSS